MANAEFEFDSYIEFLTLEKLVHERLSKLNQHDNEYKHLKNIAAQLEDERDNFSFQTYEEELEEAYSKHEDIRKEISLDEPVEENDDEVHLSDVLEDEETESEDDNSDDSEEPLEGFVCDACGDTFESKDGLDVHQTQWCEELGGARTTESDGDEESSGRVAKNPDEYEEWMERDYDDRVDEVREVMGDWKKRTEVAAEVLGYEVTSEHKEYHAISNIINRKIDVEKKKEDGSQLVRVADRTVEKFRQDNSPERRNEVIKQSIKQLGGATRKEIGKHLFDKEVTYPSTGYSEISRRLSDLLADDEIEKAGRNENNEVVYEV